MIASLPRYDRPETAAANDRLWALFRSNLDCANYAPPVHLTRGTDLWEDWQDSDLILSQTCGFPYRTALHDKVALVASPVHDLPCPPGYYFSVLVTHVDDPRTGITAFAGATLAYNEARSQSGWAAAVEIANENAISFGATVASGSHFQSAKSVASRQADIAAIDAVTWTMIRRWDDFAGDLKVLAQTKPTPALPFISALGNPTRELASALDAAIVSLAEEDRDILCLRGTTFIPTKAYLAIPTPACPQT